MREVIPNALAASNKARAGLSKEESARFFGPPPLIAGEDQAQYEAMRDQISAAVGRKSGSTTSSISFGRRCGCAGSGRRCSRPPRMIASITL
jgi:hypothetical protein